MASSWPKRKPGRPSLTIVSLAFYTPKATAPSGSDNSSSSLQGSSSSSDWLVALTTVSLAKQSWTQSSKNHIVLYRECRELSRKARPDRDAAILRYVRKHTEIPRGRSQVLGFPRASNYPLRKPHVMERRIPGRNLQNVYPDLNHEQNSTVAKEIGKIFPCNTTCHESSPWDYRNRRRLPAVTIAVVFAIRPFDLEAPHDAE